MRNFVFNISGAIRAKDSKEAEAKIGKNIEGGACTLKIIDVDKADAVKTGEIGFKPEEKPPSHAKD